MPLISNSEPTGSIREFTADLFDYSGNSNYTVGANSLSTLYYSTNAVIGRIQFTTQATPVVTAAFTDDPAYPGLTLEVKTQVAGNTWAQVRDAINNFVLANLNVSGFCIASSPGTLFTNFGNSWDLYSSSIKAGKALPTGYLLCNGARVSRALYPALFSVIGTSYNNGSESLTEFRLPDLRGRYCIGSGLDATRSLTNRSPGSYYGSETHSLTVSQLAAHTHSAGTMAVETQTHSHTGSSNDVDLNHTHTYIYIGQNGCVDGPSSRSRWYYAFTRRFGDRASVNPGIPAYPALPNNGLPTSTLAHGHSASMNQSVGDHTHSLTTGSGDGLLAAGHNNLQPFVVAHYFIKY